MCERHDIADILLQLSLNTNQSINRIAVTRRLSLLYQLPMQLVPIITAVVSSNLDQGEMYNIMR